MSEKSTSHHTWSGHYHVQTLQTRLTKLRQLLNFAQFCRNQGYSTLPFQLHKQLLLWFEVQPGLQCRPLHQRSSNAAVYGRERVTGGVTSVCLEPADLPLNTTHIGSTWRVLHKQQMQFPHQHSCHGHTMTARQRGGGTAGENTSKQAISLSARLLASSEAWDGGKKNSFR